MTFECNSLKYQPKTPHHAPCSFVIGSNLIKNCTHILISTLINLIHNFLLKNKKEEILSLKSWNFTDNEASKKSIKSSIKGIPSCS